MLKAKLSLDRMTDQEFIDFVRLVAERIGENATLFANPSPVIATLLTLIERIAAEIAARNSLLQQAQTMTLQIRANIDEAKEMMVALAAYVEKIADGKAEILSAAGLQPAESPGNRVGPMPMVEGLNATWGETDGEIDLQWTPIRRGLRVYEIESAPDINGPWTLLKTEPVSRTTVSGLTSGKRYWFRVRAMGSNGAGKPSDPVTRTAP